MRFEKISEEQFIKETIPICDRLFPKEPKDRYEDLARMLYKDLKLPKRATVGSCGYDFFYPITIHLEPGEILKLPTGIAWQDDIENRRALLIFPRSSLGIKYILREPNIVSIIDSDYYGCKDNGGHIHVTLFNEGKIPAVIPVNKGYSQGIIIRYELTDDDDCTGIRTGGFGSTSK